MTPLRLSDQLAYKWDEVNCHLYFVQHQKWHEMWHKKIDAMAPLEPHPLEQYCLLDDLELLRIE